MFGQHVNLTVKDFNIMAKDFDYLSKEYSSPGYLAARHVENLQQAAADPCRGMVWAPAMQQELITGEEFNEATDLEWLDDSYHSCTQMMACFVLLANDIEIEV
jgi:hypothetical protein